MTFLRWVPDADLCIAMHWITTLSPQAAAPPFLSPIFSKDMPEWLNVADEEAIELISGRPRDGTGRVNRDYIALDELDEEGHGPKHRVSFFDKRTLNKLVFIPFVIAVVIVLGLGYSFGRPEPAFALVSNGTHEFYPTTIVISLDGMHPHYISEDRTPYLDNLTKRSGIVPYMIPSFPTQTFPNHWTMVTGLYPGNHGIIGNHFFDPILGEFNNTHYEDLSPDFWGGEPIWATAKRQDRISAVHMWPGSFPESANYVSEFNKSEPLEHKITQIFEWIDLDTDQRPQLIMAYVPNIDTVGHSHGIEGDELVEELGAIDDFIAKIQQNIARRKLGDIVNMIIVSDHGMAPTSDDRILFLDDYIDMDLVEHTAAWPNVGIKLKDEFTTDQIRLNLTRSIPKDQASVFDSNEFPIDWHFGKQMTFGDRIAPIYIVPQIGWSITTHAEYEAYDGSYPLKGVHGYAPENPLMRALFIGVGPKFYAGKFDPFSNVNLYPLLCKLLNIKPAKNDGRAKFEAFNSSTYNEDYPGTPYEIPHFSNSTFSNL